MSADGDSTDIVFQTDQYSYISSLNTNGASVAAALDQNSYTLTWSNVTGVNMLDVSFAARTTSNGIPYAWLAANGLGTNDVHAADQWEALAAGDPDGDGMTTYQEWIAGTNPTDSNSVLKIVSQIVSGGAPVISWQSSTQTLNNAPYIMLVSTNLTKGWSVADTISANVPGTNTWYAPVPTTLPVFYRLNVSP